MTCLTRKTNIFLMNLSLIQNNFSLQIYKRIAKICLIVFTNYANHSKVTQLAEARAKIMLLGPMMNNNFPFMSFFEGEYLLKWLKGHIGQLQPHPAIFFFFFRKVEIFVPYKKLCAYVVTTFSILLATSIQLQRNMDFSSRSHFMKFTS